MLGSNVVYDNRARKGRANFTHKHVLCMIYGRPCLTTRGVSGTASGRGFRRTKKNAKQTKKNVEPRFETGRRRRRRGAASRERRRSDTQPRAFGFAVQHTHPCSSSRFSTVSVSFVVAGVQRCRPLLILASVIVVLASVVVLRVAVPRGERGGFLRLRHRFRRGFCPRGLRRFLLLFRGAGRQRGGQGIDNPPAAVTDPRSFLLSPTSALHCSVNRRTSPFSTTKPLRLRRAPRNNLWCNYKPMTRHALRQFQHQSIPTPALP